jgi:hypothetical protein
MSAAATTMLGASVATPVSIGAERAATKSFMSKAIVRSGVAEAPTFERCAIAAGLHVAAGGWRTGRSAAKVRAAPDMRSPGDVLALPLSGRPPN